MVFKMYTTTSTNFVGGVYLVNGLQRHSEIHYEDLRDQAYDNNSTGIMQPSQLAQLVTRSGL